VTDDELRNALDVLFAYDSGAVDSGIRDESLRTRVIRELKDRRALGGWRAQLARLVREMWLSEEAIEQGYGTEDAVRFAEWLEDQMDTPLPE
jgi:hypothetical protein